MEAELVLILAYQPDLGGPPIRVARISDRSLLAIAVQTAMREMQDLASVGESDEILRYMSDCDLERLRRLAQIFVPELRTAATVN